MGHVRQGVVWQHEAAIEKAKPTFRSHFALALAHAEQAINFGPKCVDAIWACCSHGSSRSRAIFGADELFELGKRQD
jgi:hypothetical protein